MRIKRNGLFAAAILVLIMVFGGCSFNNQKSMAIEKAIAAEMTRFPQATLIDLYKFFFQDAFGPGHMIADSAAARRFLEMELNEVAGHDTVLWYPIGYRQEFYRVNLEAVRVGKISAADLLQAFVGSANMGGTISLEEWQQEWRLILEIVEKQQLRLADFNADKARLQERLDRGEIAVHHSPAFNELYQPHYRIVHRRYFEQLFGEL